MVVVVYAKVRKEVEPGSGTEIAAGQGATSEGRDFILQIVDNPLDELPSERRRYAQR